MKSRDTRDCNQVIDFIINTRRSVINFSMEVPPKQLVEEIIQAGSLAPNSGLMKFKEYSRRFIVIPRESEATRVLAMLINRRNIYLTELLEKQRQQYEFQKELGRQDSQEISIVDQDPLSNLGTAPFFIVVAERRGLLAEEQLTLAYCMDNMWLKAIAVDLDFQLVPITVQMAQDKEFCELIGIPFGEFALDGCLIGYSNEISPPPSKLSMDDIVKWL
jgi:nitroreductase